MPRPDYFFLWMYAALALLPPDMETILLLVGIIVASFVAFLVLRPNQQARPSPASPPTSH